MRDAEFERNPLTLCRLSEAAAALGVSDETVRGLVQRGELRRVGSMYSVTEVLELEVRRARARMLLAAQRADRRRLGLQARAPRAPRPEPPAPPGYVSVRRAAEVMDISETQAETWAKNKSVPGPRPDDQRLHLGSMRDAAGGLWINAVDAERIGKRRRAGYRSPSGRPRASVTSTTPGTAQ